MGRWRSERRCWDSVVAVAAAAAAAAVDLDLDPSAVDPEKGGEGKNERGGEMSEDEGPRERRGGSNERN